MSVLILVTRINKVIIQEVKIASFLECTGSPVGSLKGWQVQEENSATILTRYAGHTSHSEGLWTLDITHRLYTAHSSPLAHESPGKQE